MKTQGRSSDELLWCDVMLWCDVITQSRAQFETPYYYLYTVRVLTFPLQLYEVLVSRVETAADVSF
jgi:hypothetical protein